MPLGFAPDPGDSSALSPPGSSSGGQGSQTNSPRGVRYLSQDEERTAYVHDAVQDFSGREEDLEDFSARDGEFLDEDESKVIGGLRAVANERIVRRSAIIKRR